MTPKEEKLDGMARKDDVRSSIHSRMKRQAILEVDTIGSLKVRRRTVIHTGQSSRQQARKDVIEKEVQDVFHITIQEGKEDEIPAEDITAAPPQLEDGGQATVDDLNELNLGTKEESKPIFVSVPLKVVTASVNDLRQSTLGLSDCGCVMRSRPGDLGRVQAGEMVKLTAVVAVLSSCLHAMGAMMACRELNQSLKLIQIPKPSEHAPRPPECTTTQLGLQPADSVMEDLPLRHLFPLGTNPSASFSSSETKYERWWFVDVQGGAASEVPRLRAGQSLRL
ncbi:hypothetical protein ACFX19_002401 [Malus domestica]